MSTIAHAEKSADVQSTKDLLKQAVHTNKPISRRGALERIFTLMFKSFVYPQIWEDPRVDLEAMELNEDCHIMAISSGGCNIMNYLIEHPAKISGLDLNEAHVALTRLKLSAIKHLPDYESFFRFFGMADKKENIENYDQYIRNNLDPVTRDYWEAKTPFRGRQINYFKVGLYRYGLLGRFIRFYNFMAGIYGHDMSKILKCSTIEEQNEIFTSQISPLFDKWLVRRLCNIPITLYGLGIPPAQYDFLLKEANGDMAALLKDRLRKLACNFPSNDNYFAWQAFGMGYDTVNRNAVPDYLKEENYETLKANSEKASVNQTTLHEWVGRQPDKSVDRYVLLDAQDWMNKDVLNALWKDINRTAKPGARVICRAAGENSPVNSFLDPDLFDKWTYDADKSKALSAKDRSSIYGSFHLYTLKD